MARASSSISTWCATITGAFARALPDDARFSDAVKANPAPEVLSLLAASGSCSTRPPSRDRDVAGRRRHARSHQFRQHDKRSATSPAPLELGGGVCSRSSSRPKSRRSPALRARKVFCRILVRRSRRRMAAVPQVRLRSRNGDGRARTCPPVWASSAMAFRSMSDRRSSTNPRMWDGALKSASENFP